jgi:DNA primase
MPAEQLYGGQCGRLYIEGDRRPAPQRGSLCPDGVGKPSFFQKYISAGLPAGVNNVQIPNRKTEKEVEFLTVNTVEGLFGLMQLGVLERWVGQKLS